MTRFLLLLTIVVSLMMGVGCKKTQTVGAPSETPATTKKPSVKPLSSSTLPQPTADLATVTPVKTFPIKPPISFTSDQLPSTGVSEFTFDAKAGQYLQLIIEQDHRLSNPPPS